MNTYIKIFGERNSGTTYLEELIALNTQAVVLKLNPSNLVATFLRKFIVLEDVYLRMNHNLHLGWKHGVPDQEVIGHFAKVHKLSFLTISKDPYSFLLSLYKRPYHLNCAGLSFAQFIEAKFPLRVRDNLPLEESLTPVELWNKKNRAFLDSHLGNVPSLHVRYEDLLEDTEESLFVISRALDLNLNDNFIQVSGSTKGADLGFSEYRKYYLSRSWLKALTRTDIDAINKQLDRELVREIGYELI